MGQISLTDLLKALVSNGVPESCINEFKYKIYEGEYYYSLEPCLDVGIYFSFSADDPKIKEILLNLQNKKMEDTNET